MRPEPLVLIVDDNPDLLSIASMRLTAAGFAVETARDASEGIKKAKELIPDLVLLDIHMPGLTGTEALLDLKKDPATADMKVAFLTGMAAPWPAGFVDNKKIAKELGAVDFLDKAKDMDALPEKVREILGIVKT